MRENSVIALIPMTNDEYDGFMEISMRDHIEGQVKAGFWKMDEAERNMEALRGQLLPEGLRTPGHLFFSIEDKNTGWQVGGLWYMLLEQAGEKQYFVIDIQIEAAYRRQGYGSRAFLAIEDKARESGISKIILHVFDHNTAAKAMYDKLGFVECGDGMEKVLKLESG